MSLLAYTCSDCTKSFRDAAGLRSHCAAKKHGTYRPSITKTQTAALYTQAGTTTFVPASLPAPSTLGSWSVGTLDWVKGIESPSPIAAATENPVPSQPLPWKCSTCEISFKSKKELDGHVKKSLVHPKCEVCSEGFADKATLQLVRSLDRETHNAHGYISISVTSIAPRNAHAGRQ